MTDRDLKRLGKRLMIKYTAAQGLFWAGNLVICSYAALFLQSMGFSSTQVGIVTGTGAVLSLILQPFFTGIAEQGGRLSVRQMLMAIFSAIVVLAGLILLNPAMAVVAVLYVLMYTMVICGIALLNSLGMQYENLGIPMNYGVARSGGSLCYAVLSMCSGWFTSRFGVRLLIWGGIVIFGCLVVLIVLHDKPKKLEIQYGLERPAVQKQTEKGNMFLMIRENPRLQWFLAGVLSMFIGYGMLCTYMINIVGRFGGADEEMGMALGLAALIEIPGMLLANHMIKKQGATPILRICCITFIAKAVLLVCAVNYPILILAQVLHFSSYGFFAPASVYYVNDIVPSHYKVSGQVALGMMDMGLSGVIANFLGGYLIDKLSVTAMLVVNLLFVAVGTVLIFVGTGRRFQKDK